MFTIANTELPQLLLGSGKFSSPAVMIDAIHASGTGLVTVALKRLKPGKPSHDLISPLRQTGVNILPNTSGAVNAKEAVLAAELARELLQTHWVKLEIHPDPRFLMPDPEQTLIAARELVKLGFVVLPYCSADPMLCLRLQEAGCAAVMPLGAAIGSNQGLQTQAMLEIIIEQAKVPVIIDAGLGLPSHACAALEMGAAAVLVNTAIATAADPVQAAHGFRLAVEAGAAAQAARCAPASKQAHPSSPVAALLSFLS